MIKKAILLFWVLFLPFMCFPQQTVVQELKKELEQTTDPEAKIKVLNGLVRTLAANSPHEAIAYGLESVELAESCSNQALLANSYHNVGAVYQLLGNYRIAADYNYKALEIRETIGDSLGICTSYNNIGNINNYLEAYPKALLFYQKSLAIARRIKNQEAISRALNNLGYSYQLQKNLKKSLHYYHKALKIKEEIGDKTGQTVSLINIGDLHVQSGNIRKGIGYLEKGLALAQETDHQLNAGYALRGLAEAYQKEGNLAKATAFARSSLEVARQQSSFFEIKNAADVLNSIYLQAGDFEKAHEYLTLSSTYKDSLHNESSRRQIEELQVKYESEKKEKENIKLLTEQELQLKELRNQKKIIYLIVALLFTFALLAIVLYKGKQQFRRLNKRLTQKNEKISRSRQKLSTQKAALKLQASQLQEQKTLLEKSNHVKNKLFSIVAHDLRSPLVSLSNMIQLLRKGAIPDHQKERFLELVEAEQQNALWLIDNLFIWAKSQMSGASAAPVPLNLHKLTNENIKLLQPQANKKAIRLENAISLGVTAFADKEMVKLVLRNLISNAIKFCIPGDSIRISANTEENDYIVVSVRDTGVGIAPDNLKRLFNSNFTSKGTSNEKGSGLGLQLCKDFIELNGGKIWVESEPGKGSNFLFTVPAAQPAEQAPEKPVKPGKLKQW